jgi:EAL and modified HD-GYP domain-containing signal transduction protein
MYKTNLPMKIYVARQPIFTAQKKIFGYELLFRAGFENAFPDVEGDIATARVLTNTFFTFELKEILGGKPGLINFTRDLIIKKIPLFFPKDHIIIEVLENIEPEPEIINALKEFKHKGFRIALDDFIYDKKFNQMIALSAMIKFDLMATPLSTLAPVLESDIIRSNHLTLLAEKVETHQEFEQAKQMGFGLFQGYFFSKPEILSKQDISANQITKFKLISEVGKSEMNLALIEDLIKMDVSVSFKLLKFINSSYFRRRNSVDTIKDAIMILGEDELKKFICVVVVSDLNPAKPNELIRTSITRARLCELCGSHLKTGFSIEKLFTIGLFSAMDAIMDMEMKDILATIDLSERLKDALLGRNQTFQKLLGLVTTIARGNWDQKVFKLIDNTRLMTRLPEYYADAVKMSDAFFTMDTSG